MKSNLLESIRREFSWSRPITTYNTVQRIYSAIIRGKSFQLRKLRNQNIDYINVGCGESDNKNFINIDYQWKPHVHLCWDITNGLPFGSSSVKGVFVEHCIEHITFSQCEKLLKEFYRILKPSGLVRIICPDAELYVILYNKQVNGEKVLFPYVSKEDIDNGFTPMMAINRIFRNHGHKYAYDAPTLALLLRKAGFDNIRKVEFMKGEDSSLLIDSEFRKVESFYVEASKP